MRSRPARTPCLGERLSALADGSMRDDVLARALAHTLTCPTCKDGLQDELRLRQQLLSSAVPDPSEGLLAGLIAMGGPRGPVPGRRPPGPGWSHPSAAPFSALPSTPFSPAPQDPVPTAPPALLSWLAQGRMTAPAVSTRSTGSGARPPRRAGRTLATAAIGALGAGAVAAGVLTSPPPGSAPVPDFTVRRTTPADRGPGVDGVLRPGLGGDGLEPAAALVQQRYAPASVRDQGSSPVPPGWPVSVADWARPTVLPGR